MLTVTQYQRGLAHYYGCYKGKIDGKAGPVTKAAVKKFQRLQGLSQDGKYGPKTNAALVAIVKQIQAIVGVKQDGVCGPATVARSSGDAITAMERPRLPADPVRIFVRWSSNANAVVVTATGIRQVIPVQSC